MARVTRSRKIEIAEDNTALAIQTPLPNTPESGALSEHNVIEASNKMVSVEESAIHDQLKSLKAAYRTAIGAGKRGKKGKNKKKGQAEQEQEQQDGHAVDNFTDELESSMPDAFRLSIPSHEGSLELLLDTLAIPHLTTSSEGVHDEQQPSAPAPTGRVTRHQLAKQEAQSGQCYSSDIFDTQERVPMDVPRPREYSFLSLFGGRPTGSSRVRTISSQKDKIEEVVTDYGVSLADEAAKSTDEIDTLVHVDSLAEAEISPTDGDIRHFQKAPQDAATTDGTSTVITLEEVEAYEEEKTTLAADSESDDSFVEQIISRSPAKPVSRIEDSVEALDQLEEALDALNQAALAETLVSTEKGRRRPQAGTPTPKTHLEDTVTDKVRSSAQAVAKVTRKPNPSKQASLEPGHGSMRVKSTATKQPPSIKKATSMTFKPATSATSKPVEEEKKSQPISRTAAKRPASLLPPKEPFKSTKPPTRPAFELPGEAVARKLKEQREARLAQRESSEDNISNTRAVSGPKVAKSTKPPTKADFELPGEAVSRRKREAMEARLKAQEEEERKRREFKAKPLRKSIVPDYVPRDTVASRARQSRIGLENMEGELSVSKRSSVVGAHRPSLQQLNLANMSAPRAPGPSRQLTRKPSTSSGPSMSGLAMQRTVSEKEVQIQRQRAKEIYNRDARLTEDMEREKQEREAAAKRAREEAAERGRQASREWAEKQKAKKMAEGDKGLSAGFGPGGQMGLK